MALPRLLTIPGRDQAVLDASRASLGLFVSEGRVDQSVRQLALHAGLSERTFYRYFPRKEEVIRPYFLAGLDLVVATVRDMDGPLVALIPQAVAPLLEGAHAQQGGVLLRLVEGDEALRGVWLQVLEQAERELGAVVAARAGLAEHSVEARLAGAVIVAAGRVALREEAGRAEVFARCLGRLRGAFPDEEQE